MMMVVSSIEPQDWLKKWIISSSFFSTKSSKSQCYSMYNIEETQMNKNGASPSFFFFFLFFNIKIVRCYSMLLNENVPATIDRWLVLHFCLFLLFLLISSPRKRKKRKKRKKEKREEKKRKEEKRREEKKRKEEVPNVQMYSHTK